MNIEKAKVYYVDHNLKFMRQKYKKFIIKYKNKPNQNDTEI